MSDYVETFTKVTGNTIDAADFETEFDAIVTAVQTKANKISSATADNVVEQDSNGDLVDTGIATNTVVTLTASQALTNKTLTSPTITTATITASSLTSDGLTLTDTDSTIVFEGSTANDFETTLGVTDPTADRTATLQNATGKLMVMYSGTITTASLSSLADAQTTVTHGLGTDNVTVMAIGECNTGSAEGWGLSATRPDGKSVRFTGKTTIAIDLATTPSSGNVNIKVKNNSGGSSVVVINYMIIASI